MKSPTDPPRNKTTIVMRLHEQYIDQKDRKRDIDGRKCPFTVNADFPQVAASPADSKQRTAATALP